MSPASLHDRAGSRTPMGRGDRVLQLAACLSVAVFLLFAVHAALFFPLVGDDAMLASVARNFAWGLGWATSYGMLHPFDPEITSGPGLLGFVALGIKLFGNALWVPRVFSLLLNLLLWALLLWRLQPLLDRRRFHWALLLWPLALARIHADMWFTCLGEAPAFLYLALATVLLYEGLEKNRRALLLAAGFVAGLAWLTKLVAVIALGGLFLLPGLYALLGLPAGQGVRRWGQGLWLVPGLLVTVLPWSVYEHLAVSGLPVDMQRFHASEVSRNFLNMGSGVGSLLAAWQEGAVMDHVLKMVQRNIPRFSRDLSQLLIPGAWYFRLFLASLAILAVVALRHRQDPLRRLQLAFLLPTASYLLWMVCLNDWPFPRHMYVGLLLGVVVLGLAISRHALPPMLAAVYLLASALLAPSPDFIYGDFYRWYPGEHPALKAQREALAVIGQRFAQEPLAGCGYQMARDIEYALPVANRITDCHRLLGEVLEFDDRAFLARYPDIAALPGMNRWEALRIFIQDKQSWGTRNLVAPVQWTGRTEFVLLQYPLVRIMREPTYYAIQDYCREKLYDDGSFYTLYRCRQEDLERAIRERGGIGFALPQWQVELLQHDAAQGR